ncbi:MAG: hypothetical protein HQK73_03835 [Desulfamplus sp.]|nr:hypothetical protein [Desulfamplus sp.]
MSDMKVLKEMLNNSALVKIEKHYSTCKTTLIEPQCNDSSVEISFIPENAVVLKIDNFPAPASLFNGKRGECKRADYAIIAQSDGKKRVLFIELKRIKDSKNEIIQQMKGSTCCYHYLQEIGKHFWNKPDFLNGFEFRYISFGHTSVRKQRTRITKDSLKKHDSPENMMKIDWPSNIRFNHLAGA